MALVPFEPSGSDLEKAIVDVTEGQTISLLTDLPTTSNAKFTPGSTWGKNQLCALNVIVLLNIENHRIIPGEYIPDDDDKDFSLLKGDIGRVDIDGLKDFDKDDLSSSKFTELFSYLSVCMRTGISEETILKREHGRERVLSDLSLLSTSSDEDKAEDASERACQYFISGILDSFQSIRFLSLEKGKYGDKLAVYAHCRELHLPQYYLLSQRSQCLAECSRLW